MSFKHQDLKFLLFVAERRGPSVCWQGTDFENQKAIVIKELIVVKPWSGEVEQQVLLRIFHLDEFREASVMFAWICGLDKVKMALFRQVGFRRVANSDLFCMARDPAHPSRLISADEDAPYATQPIPIPCRSAVKGT
ncbi:hypothetical protein B0H17DRAFT_1218970 [Mycena rosella]|uniref:Uncharacterized protein n=1 Tax=Mycena rosella TaxID=1033263 RepID=A0AAD7BL70_MYCRO|nr:hypothetical protein B0H17DRAFT_1218970 [Mycena rosella]